MKSRILVFWLSGLVGLTGCGDAPAEQATAEATEPTPAAAPRFAPQALAAARAAILAEPKVKDLHFQEQGPIEWQIGVLNDGTPRFGYAGHICMVLREHQVLDAETDVRIVDIGRVADGADFRSSSLGTISCSDERRLDDAPAARA